MLLGNSCLVEWSGWSKHTSTGGKTQPDQLSASVGKPSEGMLGLKLITDTAVDIRTSLQSTLLVLELLVEVITYQNWVTDFPSLINTLKNQMLPEQSTLRKKKSHPWNENWKNQIILQQLSICSYCSPTASPHSWMCVCAHVGTHNFGKRRAKQQVL